MPPRRVAFVGSESAARMLASVWRAMGWTDSDHAHDLYEPYRQSLRTLFPLESAPSLEAYVEALEGVGAPNPHHLHLTDPLPWVVWGVRTHDDVELVHKRGYRVVATQDVAGLYPDEIDRRVSAATTQDAVMELLKD